MIESSTAMNNQPCTLSPSSENGPTLYHGSQNAARRIKVAGPKTRSCALRTLSRCRDLPTRLGLGRAMTGGRMAAPHLGHSAVPGDTSIRQREHAGNRPTSFCCDGRADSGYRSNGVRLVLVEPAVPRDRVNAPAMRLDLRDHCGEAEGMTGRIVEHPPDVPIWLGPRLDGTELDGPPFGRVEVGHGQLEVDLFGHRGLGPVRRLVIG